MEINIEEPKLCIIGDIHGRITSIVHKIIEQYQCTDTAFIIAGDVGIGFDKPGHYLNIYRRIEKRLEKSNCRIYGVRGNHDDPHYFSEENRLTFDRFQTLPDYSVLHWRDKTILVIGGASSVDVEERLKVNEKYAKYKSSRRVWWEGERPEWRSVSSELPLLTADIIVSHEVPIGLGPSCIRNDRMSLILYKHILEDRTYLFNVLKELKPERWYFGHHHTTISGMFRNTYFRGLDIDEVVEVRYDE